MTGAIDDLRADVERVGRACICGSVTSYDGPRPILSCSYPSRVCPVHGIALRTPTDTGHPAHDDPDEGDDQ